MGNKRSNLTSKIHRKWKTRRKTKRYKQININMLQTSSCLPLAHSKWQAFSAPLVMMRKRMLSFLFGQLSNSIPAAKISNISLIWGTSDKLQLANWLCDNSPIMINWSTFTTKTKTMFGILVWAGSYSFEHMSQKIELRLANVKTMAPLKWRDISNIKGNWSLRRRWISVCWFVEWRQHLPFSLLSQAAINAHILTYFDVCDCRFVDQTLLFCGC